MTQTHELTWLHCVSRSTGGLLCFYYRCGLLGLLCSNSGMTKGLTWNIAYSLCLNPGMTKGRHRISHTAMADSSGLPQVHLAALAGVHVPVF